MAGMLEWWRDDELTQTEANLFGEAVEWVEGGITDKVERDHIRIRWSGSLLVPW